MLRIIRCRVNNMNYEEHNKLIELAASNEALAKELSEANSKYTKQMQDYLIALAESFGIEVTPDCFSRCEDKEINDARDYKLKLIGLILKKRPELRNEVISFSRDNESRYAEEKAIIGRKYGLCLDLDFLKKVTMWTGIM